MLRSLKYLLLLLLSSTILTSCFEIREQVDYKSNGSGSYKMVMDMSEMKFLLEMAQNSGEEDMEDPFGEMDSTFMEAKQALNRIDGLTNIVEINDQDNLYFGFSFDFESVEALNKGLNEVQKESDSENYDPNTVTFKGSKKLFQRLDTQNMMGELGKALGGMEEGGEDAEMAMSMFKDVKYVTTYNFDRKVKKVSNPESELSNNSKTVTTTYFLFDKEKMENATFENKIKLKGWLF